AEDGIRDSSVTGVQTCALPICVSYATPLFADRALNSEVWDVEGKRYVDFAGGIAVLNTGHCHPHVVAAIRAQLDRFTHTCFQVQIGRASCRERRGDPEERGCRK